MDDQGDCQPGSSKKPGILLAITNKPVVCKGYKHSPDGNPHGPRKEQEEIFIDRWFQFIIYFHD